MKTVPAFGSLVRQLMAGRRGFEGGRFCEVEPRDLLEDTYRVQCTRVGYGSVTAEQILACMGDEHRIVGLVYQACVDAYREASKVHDLRHETIPFRIGLRSRKRLQFRPLPNNVTPSC